jgi:hypothetical protein
MCSHPLVEPISGVMQRKMLLGIKKREVAVTLSTNGKRINESALAFERKEAT